VAILLSDRENDLFYDVPPIDFLQQVSLDQDGANACNTSVKKLIDRFNAVRTLNDCLFLKISIYSQTVVNRTVFSTVFSSITNNKNKILYFTKYVTEFP